jgi:hypothetical protein
MATDNIFHLNVELSPIGSRFSYRYLFTLHNDYERYNIIYADLNKEDFEDDLDAVYHYVNQLERDGNNVMAYIVDVDPNTIAIKLNNREIDRYYIEDNIKYKLFKLTVKYYNDVLALNKSDCINYFENFKFYFLNKLRTILLYGEYSYNTSYNIIYDDNIQLKKISINIENNFIYVECFKNNPNSYVTIYEPYKFIQDYSIYNIINIIIPFTVDFCIVNNKSNEFYISLMNKVVKLHNEMIKELPIINDTNIDIDNEFIDKFINL